MKGGSIGAARHGVKGSAGPELLELGELVRLQVGDGPEGEIIRRPAPVVVARPAAVRRQEGGGAAPGPDGEVDDVLAVSEDEHCRGVAADIVDPPADER